MGEPHVVSALKEKVAEISGVIKKLEDDLSRRRDMLTHLTATLRYFAPECEVGAIRPRAPRKRNIWFERGQCSSLALSAVRTAGGSVTTREVVEQILAAKGIDPSDALARDHIQKMALRSLNHAHRKGLLERTGGGPGVNANWAVAD